MEHSTPFFSIVIPTKNRPDYLKESILSVLQQDFDDFELIVSDNFNEQPTQDVIASFADHPKFVSYRTSEEMNMISHWEFATKKANGTYVILLADRKLMYAGSLKKIASELRKNPDINAFSLGVKVYNDLEHKMGWNVTEFKTQRFATSDLIRNFLSENYYSANTLDLVFPKTLNGGYKNEFAKKVRSISGTYFNNKGVTTPDYSSLFVNLTLNDSVLHIGGKMMLWQGEHTSNGRHFGAGKFEAYMKTLGLEDPYPLVSIKAPFIYNLLHVDLWTIASIFGGNLKDFSVDWDNYFHTNYWEFLTKEKLALPDVDLSFFEKAIDTAMEVHKNDIQNFHKDTTRNLFDTPVPVAKFDRVRHFRTHLRDFVAHRYGSNKIAQQLIKTNYASGLEAAGFK